LSLKSEKLVSSLLLSNATCTATDGWPAHLRDRLGNASHGGEGEPKFAETTCRICAQGFSSLWWGCTG
jgi:hypothetical protein